MKFDPSVTIDGMSLIRVRDFLPRFESAFDETHVSELLGLRGAATQRWLQAAIARGLVAHSGGETYELAPDGIRLCTKKFVGRLDRAKADRIVGDLLRRTEAAAAARWDYLLEVTGLAVFGSYRDQHAVDFGDVDVLLGIRRLPEIQLGEKKWSDRCWDLFERDQRRSHHIGDHLIWPYEKLKRDLRARNPYLGLHPMDDAEVIETDVRIIYELPEGRLAPPRDCRTAEFVEAVERVRIGTNPTRGGANWPLTH